MTIEYELASSQGFIDDPRLRHPRPGTYDGQFAADAERFGRWQREARSGRGEVYLRLRDLDLDDVDAILEFASTFGVLDIRALDVPRVERQWYGVAAPKPVPFRVLRNYPGFGDGSRRATLDETLRAEVVAAATAQRDAAPVWVISDTIDEFRWGARALRDLQTGWGCLRSGGDPRAQRWANPRMPSQGDDLGWAAWAVAEFVERTMRDALEGFSPRMWLVDEQSGHARHEAVTTPEPDDVTLFEVLALELFRHIAEDASYKRCANPTCNRMFVRQEGGAVHGQSRMTGVKSFVVV